MAVRTAEKPFVVAPDDAPTLDVSPQGVGTVIKHDLVASQVAPPNFAMRLFDVAPAGATPYHQHPWEHEVFIVEGAGELKTASGAESFAAGEAVYVPPDAMHQFRNTGEGRLKFICVIPNSGDC